VKFERFGYSLQSVGYYPWLNPTAIIIQDVIHVKSEKKCVAAH